MKNGLAEMFGLEGRTALVTGGSRGIGKGMAKGLALAGANVAVVARHESDAAAQTMKELKETGAQTLFVQADVSKRQSVDAAVRKTSDSFGHIDILVNNAGIGKVAGAVDCSDELWDETMDVNIKGMKYCCQAVGKQMIERKYGRIINLASYWASTGNPGGLAYSVSKAGVLALTRVLAVEWGPYNITVNAVAPGYIMTDMNQWVVGNRKVHSYLTDRIPLGHKLGEIDDCMGLAVFLASRASAYITGTLIPIDGGIAVQASQADWFT